MAMRLLMGLANRGNLSMRALHRMRRVARTIQDIDPNIDPREPIRVEAIALAARLRRMPDALMCE